MLFISGGRQANNKLHMENKHARKTLKRKRYGRGGGMERQALPDDII